MSVYKNVVRDTLVSCINYRNNKINQIDLERIIANAADQIILIDEKDLRGFLFDKEWDLELMRFTVDDEKIFEESLKIVDEIEERLKKELETD